MNDLQLILYIAIAIGVAIFKNYQKFQKQAEERAKRLKQPAPPVVDNQPQTPVPVPAIASPKMPKRTVRTFKSASTKSKRKEPDTTFFGIQEEGGSTHPSSIVMFDHAAKNDEEFEHPIVAMMRNQNDLRMMVIGSEILQRPYK